MFSVKVDADKVRLRFDALPDKLRQALGLEARSLASELQGRARDNAASFLKQHTGGFAASIEETVRVSPRSIVGKIFSKHPAAAILEFGGTIPPHEIAPKTAQALRFMMSEGEVFAQVVHAPGGTIKPHPIIHGAFDQMKGEIASGMTEAAEGVLNADA
jgi:hypothetical protein